jgi:hypothetical protein
MVDQQQITLSNLFSQYVALRQSGKTMDEVVQVMQDLAYKLARDDRHQLGRLVQDWEDQNSGGQAAQTKTTKQPAGEGSSNSGIRRIAAPAANQAAQSPAAFGTRFLDPSKLPGASVKPADASVIRPISKPSREQLTCPNCGKNNKVGEAYCYSCGHILESSETMTKPLDKADVKYKLGTAYFGQADKLTISIRGASNDIHVELRDELVMGRASAQGPLRPDIDLSSFNAEQQGVSRLHAAFRRQENTVVLVDLGSANKTFINGQRVYPHEVRVMRSGDEIRLGKMTMKVSFKRV